MSGKLMSNLKTSVNPERPILLSAELIKPPVLSSQPLTGNSLIVERYNLQPNDVEFSPLTTHLITINLGGQGELWQKQDGHSHKALMVAGSITLTPAGQPRQWRWNHEVDVLNIRLSPQLVTQVAQSAGLDVSRIELVNRFGVCDSQLTHLGLSLLTEVKSPKIAAPLYIESLANLLTIHLLRHYSTLTPTLPPVTGKLSPLRMRQVIEYIHDNLEQSITVADLAAVAGLSHYHFTRLFRQEMGLAPHQYIIQARVQQAEQLLTTGTFSLAEVAHHVGFADQSHLTRHFKRLVGVTPKVVLQNSKNILKNRTNLQDSLA